MKKNPNYWPKGLPKLDSISFRPVLEDATRVAMLRTGETQFVDVVPPEHVERLKRLISSWMQHLRSCSVRSISNNTKKPSTTLRVRQALNYGLDKRHGKGALTKGLLRPA